MRHLVVLFALPALSLAASCSLLSSPDPAVDTPLFVSDGTPCGGACAQIFNCDSQASPASDQSAFNSCITNCAERTDPVVAACLANATECGALDACMPRPDSSFCGQACRRFAACSDNPEETLAQCTCNDHSGGAMRCVAEAAGCGEIEACLRDAPKEAGCRRAFDKMISCEYAEEAERAQWTSTCVESIASQRYDCIEEAPCDVLVARCFPLMPFPDCGEVCRRYKRCAVIDEAAVAACTTRCTTDEWSPTALACLVRTSCDEIAGACEVQP